VYQHSTRLPHVLSPGDYCSAEQYECEVRRVFVGAWHVVGTKADLAQPGSFVTVDLFGHPVQVRNFDGEIHALANTCVHRHALISSEPQGCSTTMRCQYHGWEYDRTGSTRKIPQARCFAPFDRAADKLTEYRVAFAGQLVFVSLVANGPSLEACLGELYPLVSERFGDSWRQSMSWSPDYPVNWKIPVENSIEAYHVAAVHPRTFKTDPGEARTQHRLESRFTWFDTHLPFAAHSRLDAFVQRVERSFVRAMGATPTDEYRQVHAFPNLLFSFTDTLSLCHAVVPTSPTTSRAVVRQFSRFADAPRAWQRVTSAAWGKLTAAATRQILNEDIALYPALQRGLAASRNPGILGRCEERIYAFQRWLADRCDATSNDSDSYEAPSSLALAEAGG
jgi:phenylpropionate dioxygenase-like ring-hydroxylating dioxygenase large terminal subunit